MAQPPCHAQNASRSFALADTHHQCMLRSRQLLTRTLTSALRMSDQAAPKRALSASPPPLAQPTSPRPPLKKAKLEDAPVPAPVSTAAEVALMATSSETVVEGVSALVSDAAPKAAGSATQGKKPDGKALKGRQPKGRGKAKPHKPGGAEETGAFDVLELLGAERVAAMELAAAEAGQDWRAEAEAEWGKAQDGKDVEVRVVGMSAHGAFCSPRKSDVGPLLTLELRSAGDGLAILSAAATTLPTRILTIPFTLPNELALVHIHRHEPDYFMSHADLVRIIEPSPDRAAPALEIEASSATEVSPELAAVRAKFGERVQCKYFGTCSGCQVRRPPSFIVLN